MRISDWSSDVCSSDLKLDRETAHRQVKYLNNVIEADHGKLKILIKPVRGFKSNPTAYATNKGFEVMRAMRKGQASPWCLKRSEEHTYELQSLMRNSYAVFCSHKKKQVHTSKYMK